MAGPVNAGPSRPAGGSRPRPWAGVGAFALTATVLAIARLKAPFTILLAAWLLLKDYLGGLRYVGYGVHPVAEVDRQAIRPL